MQKKVSVLFMLLGILFNICLVASNLLETKVISLFGITATAGLIVFPISYIINDCIAEIWGFRKARLIIWCGFLSNFLIIAFVSPTGSCGKSHRISFRLFPQRLRDEQDENCDKWKIFLPSCNRFNTCRREYRLPHILPYRIHRAYSNP